MREPFPFYMLNYEQTKPKYFRNLTSSSKIFYKFFSIYLHFINADILNIHSVNMLCLLLN